MLTSAPTFEIPALHGVARSWRLERSTLFALLGFSALRAALMPTFGLMPQDAYYFFYAEHPSLSYLDHPPMIAVVLGLFAAILGKSDRVNRSGGGMRGRLAAGGRRPGLPAFRFPLVELSDP